MNHPQVTTSKDANLVCAVLLRFKDLITVDKVNGFCDAKILQTCTYILSAQGSKPAFRCHTCHVRFKDVNIEFDPSVQ